MSSNVRPNGAPTVLRLFGLGIVFAGSALGGYSGFYSFSTVHPKTPSVTPSDSPLSCLPQAAADARISCAGRNQPGISRVDIGTNNASLGGDSGEGQQSPGTAETKRNIPRR